MPNVRKENSEKYSEYIPLSAAGKILNTSGDYMKVLVRRGKLHALKLGRNWFTTREWLLEYQKSVGRPAVPVEARLQEVPEVGIYPKSEFGIKEISKKLGSFISSHEIKLPSRALLPD